MGIAKTIDVREQGRISARTAVAVAYVVSLFTAALDTHALNVMLPTLTIELDSPLAAVQWTVLAYVLALAIAMPASGWLATRFGDRRVFLVSLGVFTVASALCGLARYLPELIALRVVQGAAGGLVMTVATAMLFRVYPPEQRARLVRTLLLPIALGPALAPPLGGLLVDHLSWRWIFLVNVPVGAATMALVAIGLPRDPKGRPGRFDLPGYLLAGVGLAALLLALTQGPEWGWGSPAVLVLTVLGPVAVAGSVAVQLRSSAPLLDLRLLGGRLFRQTNIATAFQTATFLGGILFITPIFLQEETGLSPLQAGLVMSLVPIGVVISSQTVGRRYHVIGPRLMSVIGLGLLGVICLCLALFGGSIPMWVFCGLVFLAGLTNGSAMVGLQASMFAQIGTEHMGSASTLLNVNRQVTTAVGIATATMLMTSLASDGGFRLAYLVTAVFALLGALAAVLIHDSEAAETMRNPAS
ncbi:DHA2 family efflux MFS transporter permease subunit [Pseudonocardia sp. NPDC049635]|uniref:DHA2 family efflux MFS transporter permease subunit n=1 Tax=Pseudonocardia sp. NPDC049635 TaxID=3155506 RepID=UPI0033D058E5